MFSVSSRAFLDEEEWMAYICGARRKFRRTIGLRIAADLKARFLITGASA